MSGKSRALALSASPSPAPLDGKLSHDPKEQGRDTMQRSVLGATATHVNGNGNGNGNGMYAASRGQNGAQSIPFVSGSGARVPTQFLDHKGSFSSRPVYASQEAGPSAARGMLRPNSISPPVLKQETPAASAPIDLTEDDGDDFSIVQATGPDLRADLDEDICVGLINAVALAMFGLPASFVAPPGVTRVEDFNADPMWKRQGWPPGYDFYLEPGYRPVEISTSQQGNVIAIHEVVPPLLAQKDKDGSGRLVPHVRHKSFGNLADKYNRAILPLLTRGLVQFSGRIRIVPPNSSQNFLHALELLCFTKRRTAKQVTDFLYAQNITLEYPRAYSPTYFAKQPVLEVPQYRLSRTGFPGRGPVTQPIGQYRGTLIQQKEYTEDEKRRQVDSVYASLPDGEDLPQAEPSDRISTCMLAHQKQALAFLLEREKWRSFKERADSRGEGGSNGSSARPAGDIVSLWKLTRKGKMTTYENVVTQGEQMRAPHICRGAILADDMGLGKTLVAIGLIASTMEEAQQFEGHGDPSPDSDKPTAESTPNISSAGPDSSGSDDDVTISDFTINVHGAPPQKKSRAVTKQKKKGKRELAREEAAKMRTEQIKCRSRATLVVLPLTLVSAWEGQIEEHWDSDRLPRVYVHHGTNRHTHFKHIAKHDIVFTTYSTLASEYSMLTADEDGSEDEGENSEEILLTDELGNDVQPRTAAEKAAFIRKEEKMRKKKARLAKRKRRGGCEGAAPLQQINWFRIILDEAHTIKEASTLQSRAVCHLVGSRRVALTGTPVQNRMDDLYSLMRFLKLEPFDDRGVWNQFCGAKEKAGSLRTARRANTAEGKNAEPLDAMALARVQTIMKFLTLRRTKDTPGPNGKGKLLDLPPKYSRVLRLDFDDHERATYNAMQQRYVDEFVQRKEQDTLKYNYATILHEISNLRMTCDHMELVDASVDAKRRRELATANGLSDRDDIVDDPSLAIQQHGLSRQRAIRFFDLLSSSDAAHCSICNDDLADFANNELDEEAVKRPVVTKCPHFFCSTCMRERIGSSNLKSKSEETRVSCPDCGVILSPLLEIRELTAADVEGGQGVPLGNELAQDKFGCDLGVPLEKRSDYSSKIRALIEELESFSRSNPSSRLYDPSGPILEQVAVEGHEGDAVDAQEKVVVQSALPDGRDLDGVQPIKSIVFSQWTKMLDRVARAVHRSGIKATSLDGRMHRQARSESLESFRSDPSVEVLLVSLKAGGVGLNLVSACRAYLMEPYWNPATENQGLDRIHRMGQTRPVVMTKYVMGKSIEENMLALQKRKMQLAESIGGKRRTQLQRDEELGILFGIGQEQSG